jgi:hypothetical protein
MQYFKEPSATPERVGKLIGDTLAALVVLALFAILIAQWG